MLPIVKQRAVLYKIIININITVTDVVGDMEMQSDDVIGHRGNRTSDQGQSLYEQHNRPITLLVRS